MNAGADLEKTESTSQSLEKISRGVFVSAACYAVDPIFNARSS